MVSDRSVSGSTALVASSRTSRPGSASWARSRATSWRSPTLQALAPLAHLGVEAVGQAGDPPAEAELVDGAAHVVERWRRGGPWRCSRRRWRRRRSRPGAPCGCARCATAGRRRAGGTPPTRDRALGGVGEAAQQLGEGGLARAGLAHDGDARPGRDVDVDVAQHGPAGAVGEADARGRAPRADRAGSARPSSGSTSVDRGVEQVEHLATSRRWRSGSGRGSRPARRWGRG